MPSLKDRLRRRDLRIEDRGGSVYLLSSLAHYGLRAVMPTIRRDATWVTNEYNHERDEYWKPALTEDEFVYGDGENPTWVLLDHKLVRGTAREVRLRLLKRLRDRVVRYSKPGDLIVEFGAGTGRNMAYLARELPDRQYVGIELTPRSVEDAKKILAHFALPVEMRIGDMTKPLGLDRPAAVAFSVLALEQLPGHVSREALKQMASTATRAIVCFEPIRELFPFTLRGITSRLRQYRADYLAGMPAHARELGLKVVVQERTGLAHNALNEICEFVAELDHTS
jgi:SAM-dependent methyltransferase